MVGLVALVKAVAVFLVVLVAALTLLAAFNAGLGAVEAAVLMLIAGGLAWLVYRRERRAA